MKICNILFLIPFIFFSCKKSDSVNKPQGSTVIPEANFQISKVVKTELNEVDISYNVTEVSTGDFSTVYFEWSTDPDFKINSTTVPLTASTVMQTFIYHVGNLKEFTRYYGRLSATYRNVKSFSSIKEWITDSLKIIRAGEQGILRGFNKGDTTFVHTNIMDISGTNSKVFIGPFECPVVKDNGSGITFSVPASIPAGKYVFRVITHGMDAQASDSAEVLRGSWQLIPSPDIPLNPFGSSSGLMFFGTCNSSQKGYIIGGIYFNGPQVPAPHQDVPEYFIEFDPVSQNWMKKYPASPRYFMNPNCHYYNNSIYLIGATHESIYDPNIGTRYRIVRKMMRLDLTTLNWSEMNDLPYNNIHSPLSFEFNNEWYVGMGADSSTGVFSKKFWKYNPSTNLWTQLADFPGNNQHFHATGFAVGQKAYVFYGAIPNGIDFNRELWEYSPSLNSWTQVNLPPASALPPGEKYQVISYNGKAYFLTAQVNVPAVGGFIYQPVRTCLEWEPLTGVYKQVSFPIEGNVIRNVFKQGNRFYFQSDALGYYQKIPNKSYLFTIE